MSDPTPTPRATGDDAAAAGMALVPGTGMAHDLDMYDNQTRDYVANGPTFWKPGVTVPVARIADGTITPPKLDRPYVMQGGSDAGDLTIAHGAGRAQMFAGGAFKGYIAYLADIPSAPPPGNYVSKSGDSMSGDLFIPGASPANSNYVVMYHNGDGRLSRGSSSERYKDDIVRGPALPDVFAVPPASFVMKGDPDAVTRYGYIAEDLAGHPATAGFVVFDAEGRPDSFDMLGFLFAQVARLHARVVQLEAGA